MRQRFVLLLFLASYALSAQTVAPTPGNQPLSLADALALAQDRFATIKASLEQQAAAQHQIAVAKTAYLPRLDLLWQTNRATDNNRTGLTLPQSVLPLLSGPVAGDAPGRSAWSSAGGALISWQPFDLGARAAQVNVAQKGGACSSERHKPDTSGDRGGDGKCLSGGSGGTAVSERCASQCQPDADVCG